MESVAISQHLVLVVAYAFNAPGNGWFTTASASKRTRVSPRTVRHHLRRLVQIGVLEKRTVFGGCYYKRRDEADMSRQAMDYLKRLGSVREVFEKKPGRLRTTLSSLAGMVLAI